MITVSAFPYQPSEDEAEKASNSYLMSLVALIVGLPLPIVNLLATLVFYLGKTEKEATLSGGIVSKLAQASVGFNIYILEHDLYMSRYDIGCIFGVLVGG